MLILDRSQDRERRIEVGTKFPVSRKRVNFLAIKKGVLQELEGSGQSRSQPGSQTTLQEPELLCFSVLRSTSHM